MVEIGDPDDVGNRYLELNFSEAARNDAAKEKELELDRADRRRHRRDRRGVVRGRGGRARRHRPQPAAARRSPPASVSTPTMDDPLFGVVLQNDRRETVLAASNLWSNPQSGRFVAGREIEYRVHVRQPARPGPLPRDARGGHARAAASRGSTGASACSRCSCPASRAPTRSSTCPTRSRSPRRAGRGRDVSVPVVSVVDPSAARPADQGPVGARQRPAPPLAPGAHDGGQRLQAALLRLARSATCGS